MVTVHYGDVHEILKCVLSQRLYHSRTIDHRGESEHKQSINQSINNNNNNNNIGNPTLRFHSLIAIGSRAISRRSRRGKCGGSIT